MTVNKFALGYATMVGTGTALLALGALFFPPIIYIGVALNVVGVTFLVYMVPSAAPRIRGAWPKGSPNDR